MCSTDTLKEQTVRRPQRLRRLVAATVLAAGLTLPGAAAAFAAPQAPFWVWLPDAACNGGTSAARSISGNGVVPMYMHNDPSGCMTMVGAFLP